MKERGPTVEQAYTQLPSPVRDYVALGDTLSLNPHTLPSPAQEAIRGKRLDLVENFSRGEMSKLMDFGKVVFDATVHQQKAGK